MRQVSVTSSFKLLACAATLLLGSTRADAQDATWLASPGSNNFNTGTNWSTGTVPTGIATFGGSNTTTILAGVWRNPTTVDAFRFGPGAPTYTFYLGLSNPPSVLNFTGAGIINNSSNAPIFPMGAGILTFSNSSSASNAVIGGSDSRFNAMVVFANSATAASAVITNSQSRLLFVESATAANATIVNNVGLTTFQNSATAADASITTNAGGQLQFQNTSTAGSATITTNGSTSFRDSSSAGNATLVTNDQGVTSFGGSATAGNAVIITNSGGLTSFSGTSTGGQARLINNAGGQVLFFNGTYSVGSIEGAGIFNLLGGSPSTQISVGSNNLSTEVSGRIRGSDGGSLIKLGTGTLTLSGSSSLGAGTTVSAGRLIVTGELTSDVAVGSSGTLGGDSTIIGSVINNGMVSPGNSFGSLAISGNYVQGAGSTHQVQINPAGQSSRLTVTGAALLDGAVVTVVAVPGSYVPKTTYTILTAAGGVAGKYAGASSDLAFLWPMLTYDANNVFLTLISSNAFASAARNPNQAAVGRVLDQAYPTATGDFGNVLNAIAGLSTAQAPAVLGAIGGQSYSGFSTTAAQTARTFMTSFANQTRGLQDGGHIALAQSCDIACDAEPLSRWGAWGGALGSLGTVAGDANAFGTTYSLGGFAGGLDYRFNPNFLAGVTAGYSNATLYTQGMPGQGNSSTVQVGLYGKFTEGQVYVDGLAGYAHSDNRMTRLIVIPGLSARTAYGATGADQFFGLLETGYRVELGGRANAFVTPFAALQGSTSTQAAFTESGADSLNLAVARQTTNSLRTVFGGEIGGSIDLDWHDKLNLFFRLGWSHEFADTTRPVTASFVGAPTLNFTTLGAATPRDGAVVSFSATTSVAAATSIYLRYDGDLAGGTTSHTLSAGLRMTW